MELSMCLKILKGKYLMFYFWERKMDPLEKIKNSRSVLRVAVTWFNTNKDITGHRKFGCLVFDEDKYILGTKKIFHYFCELSSIESQLLLSRIVKK